VLTYKHNSSNSTVLFFTLGGGGGATGGGGTLSTRNWGGGGGVSQQNSKTRDQVSSPKRSALSLGASHLIPTSKGARHLCGRPMAPTSLPCRSAVLTGLPQRASGRSGYTEVSNRLHTNSSLQNPLIRHQPSWVQLPTADLVFSQPSFYSSFSLFSLLKLKYIH
jgi:hypothetical protein